MNAYLDIVVVRRRPSVRRLDRRRRPSSIRRLSSSSVRRRLSSVHRIQRYMYIYIYIYINISFVFDGVILSQRFRHVVGTCDCHKCIPLSKDPGCDDTSKAKITLGEKQQYCCSQTHLGSFSPSNFDNGLRSKCLLFQYAH